VSRAGEGVAEDARRQRSLRPLSGVLAALAVSLTGTRISAVALPWFVLVTTGSVTQTGLVAFCEMAPYVVVKAALGPIVDRVGARVVSWTTDLVSAVAAAAVPFLHAVGLLTFWGLLVLVAVIGAARGPGDLAKEVMVPEAADLAQVPLERAAGASGVTERLAATVGPGIGGGVVALLGAVSSLGVIAGLFALGSLLVGLTLPRDVGRAQQPPEDGRGSPKTRSGYWGSFAEGARHLRGEPLLLVAVAMIAVTNLLDAGFRSVLLPVWAQESGNGPEGLGLAGTAVGVGAVCGSLVATAVAPRLPRRAVVFTGFLLAGVPRCLVLAVDLPLWAVLGVLGFGGLGGGFLNPVLAAVFYERVPRHMLGRVGALVDALSFAGIPFGGLIAGAVVASFGLVTALTATAATYLATITLAGLRPEWRTLDHTRGTVPVRRPPAGEEGTGEERAGRAEEPEPGH
jgi:MFS family permease